MAASNISKAPFGQLPDGTPAHLFTLSNSNGITVKITDFGGIITEIHAPDRNGKLADVTLGFDSIDAYVNDSAYFGGLIGRFGNRIANGRFVIDGETCQLSVNDGAHHLHGGQGGFHKVKWDAFTLKLPQAAGLVLRYVSADGEQGYPGRLTVTATYQLTEANELRVRYHAITDKPTPVNMTQHTYFNLAGTGNILGHELTIFGDRYTPVDRTLIPRGTQLPVEVTPFDFRTARAIGAAIDEDHEQIGYGRGYDHNYVLNHSGDNACALAARVCDPASGRVLELFTQEPGLQFYSGNFLDGSLSGKNRRLEYRSGFCLEPQHFPDSPNQASFPNTILRPGEEYRTESIYRFSVQA